MAKTPENLDLMLKMIEETRNALYGVFPHGCFAKLVGLPTDDASLYGLPTTTQVAATASPPQGGLPALSWLRNPHRKVGCRRCPQVWQKPSVRLRLRNRTSLYNRLHRQFSRGIQLQ